MISKRAVLAALAAIAASGPVYADVTISTAATQNMSCSGGVCSPTAPDAVLNVVDLENLLTSGNVTVTTTGSGVQANNIDVAATFTWRGNTLTLDAFQSIAIGAAVTVKGKSGLSLVTKAGRKHPGSELSFGAKGRITFAILSSDLRVDGTAFRLVDTISGLASAIAAKPAGAYALASNYDASADGTYPASPIATTFQGTFIGLGNTISNLSIDSTVGSSNVGLFSWVQPGRVEFVRLERINVQGVAGSFVGGLVGGSQGILLGDHVSGAVQINGQDSKTQGAAGGLAGYATYIAESSSSVSVTNGFDIGSLVGEGNTIVNSSATGPVTGTLAEAAGGLAGLANPEASVMGCFASGHVNVIGLGTSGAAGGLIGIGNGAISNSYATGRVGLNLPNGSFGYIGGFIAYMAGTISTSYENGHVSTSFSDWVGGFVGFVRNGSKDFTDTYWDTTTSGISNLSQGAGNIANYPGITGLTTGQLQSGLPPGFDPAIWIENSAINNGFPYLIANPPPN